MSINKYKVDCIEDSFNNKPLFIFVNHKLSVLYWAKIKSQINKNIDVITFDSHGDFRRGAINGESLKISNCTFFGSNNLSHLEHFSKCKEFIDWDLLDKEQNKDIIERENRFLFFNNDNFIDVAFMKNIIKDVYWYFIKQRGNSESGECEDFLGGNHIFYKKSIKDFIFPKQNFILDLDLDYFTYEDDNFNIRLFNNPIVEKSVNILKKLMNNKNCRGITIALEPSCTGGGENLRLILNALNLNLIEKSLSLINRCNTY